MKHVSALRISTPSDREIEMVRAFDAPRQLVYEAYTKPELLKQWLGVFNGWSVAVCEIDLRVGGTYRYVWNGPGKVEMGMRGEYREVVPFERLVATEVFDVAWYKGAAVGTTAFVERGGKTTVITTVRYDTQQVRDSVLQSPMEQGMAAGFDTLEKLLATLA